jgi:hypothetical protein
LAGADGSNGVNYHQLKRMKRCTRCRRRRARPGRTKCAPCAKALKVTDSDGARRRRYGASPADLQRLIAEQDGKCFCGRCVDDRSALDHEWETNDLRGVLCPTPCNSAIGRTDAELFRFAHGVGQYASRRRLVLLHRRCVAMSKAA